MPHWLIIEKEVQQMMQNSKKSFMDHIVGEWKPETLRDEMDFSIRSLYFYDEILQRFHSLENKSSLLQDKNIPPLLSAYLGEVLQRNLGGEWIGYGDLGSLSIGYFPLILYSVNGFLANPISEVVWKILYGGAHRISNYYSNLATELTKLHKLDESIRSSKKFSTIFHEDRIGRIMKYREAEYDELGYFKHYLTISIDEMNRFH